MDIQKFRSSAMQPLPVGYGNERLKYLSLLRRKATLSLHIPLLCLCVMVPGPLEDLDVVIRYAQGANKEFVEIYPCLLLLREHYRTHPDIDPHRWRVEGIIKLKKKIRLKHEFIVARLRCDNVENVQYLCLERMPYGSGLSGPGLNISEASDHAWIFSEEDPVNNPENKRLMSLMPSPGTQMTLPELLILANSIHNVSPRYKPFSTNCYWFADAMDNAMRRRYGFVINWEQEQEQYWAKRQLNHLKSFIFRKSTATEQQMNDIYDGFNITRGPFFDFQQPPA